jgi:ATP-binding cassette subfamily C protein LapB
MSDPSPPSLAENPRKFPAENCLRPLLNALDWIGDARYLCDALPDGRIVTDLRALMSVLERLNFQVIYVNSGVAALDHDTLPALLLTPDEDVWVILRKTELGFLQVFQGSKAMPAIVEPDQIAGSLFQVRRKDAERLASETRQSGTISHFIGREGRIVRQLFVITFLINCLGLVLPVYIMAVYDFAIRTYSATTLAALAGMIIMILAAEMFLRELRARALARLAVRMQISVTAAVFERLMRLPASYIENASVAGQLNRLREFESVRNTFSGPLAAALLDLPFIFVFVAAVFAMGGVLGWFLVGFTVLMAVLGSVLVPRTRISAQSAGSARSATRIFRADLTRHISTIRDSGAEDIWTRRYRERIGYQLSTALAAQNVSFVEQTLVQGLSVMTGGLIVGVGALQVIQGTLQIGALSAVIAIVWRVLSPIQTTYLNVTRVFRAIDTARQFSQLMKLPQESGSAFRSSSPPLRGAITLENVGLRQGTLAFPVLRGVDLSIQAGEFIVLAGAPGPSRSALLKLIGNLHQPSFGRILIDGCDVRQFDVRELRRRVALVSEEQVLFSGTLAQNLLLANPLADERQLRAAVADADLTGYINRLPDGLHTDLTEPLRMGGLSPLIAQKIKLARAYILFPSVYLLDEPAKNLDRRGQETLVDELRRRKGTATIIVRTSHPQIVALADRVAQLKAGLLAVEGAGKQPDTREPMRRTPSAPPPKSRVAGQ